MLTNQQVSSLLGFYSVIPKHIKAMENSLCALNGEDDIYSLAVSHKLSDMPSSGHTSNKTARIATLYRENLEKERAALQNCILIYHKIKLQIDRGLASLGEEASFEIIQHYIHKKTVEEVSFKADKRFVPCCIRLRYIHLSKSLQKLGSLIDISKHDLAAISHLLK